MKVALYARVSTGDQSTANQLTDLRAMAQRRGFTVFKEYVDHGVKGSTRRRPALDALMEDVRKRNVDAVMVWRFDRFGRSTSHLLTTLEEFKAIGVTFISFCENIDLSTPMGQAMFTMIAAVAQFERDIIRERVVAGIKAAQRKGTHCGRPQASIDIAKALKLRAKGLSIRAIGEALGESKSAVGRALAEHDDSS
jgi:DNA invertase Pin-like site-specific DNA recombinase